MFYLAKNQSNTPNTFFATKKVLRALGVGIEGENDKIQTAGSDSIDNELALTGVIFNSCSQGIFNLASVIKCDWCVYYCGQTSVLV